MGLLPLSREKCSSTPVLIDQFLSLVEERSCLVEITKRLLKHFDECVEVDISDSPPAMLTLRAMLEASESGEVSVSYGDSSVLTTCVKVSCLLFNHLSMNCWCNHIIEWS